MGISITELGGLSDLGDARSDLVDVISSIPVIGKELRPKVNKAVTDLEKLVEERAYAAATEGATKATEKIIIRGLWISAGLSIVTLVLMKLMLRRAKKKGLVGLGFAPEKHDEQARTHFNSSLDLLGIGRQHGGSCISRRSALTESSIEYRLASLSNDAGTSVSQVERRKGLRAQRGALVDAWRDFDRTCVDGGSGAGRDRR